MRDEDLTKANQNGKMQEGTLKPIRLRFPAVPRRLYGRGLIAGAGVGNITETFRSNSAASPAARRKEPRLVGS